MELLSFKLQQDARALAWNFLPSGLFRPFEFYLTSYWYNIYIMNKNCYTFFFELKSLNENKISVLKSCFQLQLKKKKKRVCNNTCVTNTTIILFFFYFGGKCFLHFSMFGTMENARLLHGPPIRTSKLFQFILQLIDIILLLIF